MEPRNLTTKEIFEGDNVYVVPRYQRLYVWNERDQWAPLWDDITAIAGKLLRQAAKRVTVEIDPDEADAHFFGTLVLKISGYTPQKATKWRVIDGQQRLTTMQLMMSAVADEMDSRELATIAKPMRNLVSNDPQEPQFTRTDAKISHGSDHYQGFLEAMNPRDDKMNIAGSMGHCYWYFRNAAEKWLDAPIDTDVPVETAADALTTVIMFKLRVVAIFLSNEDEEHKIFETLNARGEPLTEWDKIKNFMLYLADADKNVNQDEYFDKYLDTFDQFWWRESVGRGVGIRPRSDVFADYWLESKTTKAVGARRVFREFETYVNSRPERFEEIGKELVRDAEHFKKFEHRHIPGIAAETRFHNRRLAIGIGAWWPMIFEMGRIFEKLNCDDSIRAECFGFLESFLVRRLIVGHQARSYDQVGFDIMDSIHKEVSDPERLVNAIRNRFLGYIRRGNRWPNDQDVHRAVLHRNMPSYAQRIVLEAIEAEIVPNDAAYQQVPTNLEVEHLMPQGWHNNNHDWPMRSDDDITEAVALRDDLIHTLGNLTLITGGLNKSLSNRSWQHKRGLIEKSDNLFVNKRLLSDASGTWDERKIVSRGTWMAGIVCEIWPRPDDVANN